MSVEILPEAKEYPDKYAHLASLVSDVELTGDRQGLGTIAATYRDDLHTIAKGLLGRSDCFRTYDYQDIVSRAIEGVFVTYARREATQRPYPRPEMGYFVTAVRSAVFSLARIRRREATRFVTRDVLDEEYGTRGSAEDEALGEITETAFLRGMITFLDSEVQARVLLVLSQLGWDGGHDNKLQQAADILGMSNGAIRAALSRIRKRAREIQGAKGF